MIIINDNIKAPPSHKKSFLEYQLVYNKTDFTTSNNFVYYSKKYHKLN